MGEYVNKQELLDLLKKKIKADNEHGMAVVDSDFIDLVNDATEINDVVEVVRCKDCIHYCIGEVDGGKYCEILQYASPIESGYCCYGQRKQQRKVVRSDVKL